MFKKLFENNIISQLKKEFPEVISQIIGPKGPEDQENSWYQLQMIVVPYKMRTEKLGTKYMKRFIRLAKEENSDIFLTPDASYQEDDGMSLSQLTAWYKKLGFVKKHKDDFRAQHKYCLYN